MITTMNDPEPDSSETMFCPHCGTWYSRATANGELESRIVGGVESGVVEVFYCRNKHGEVTVKLIDAHSHGCLTPWEEWKRDCLIAEMNSHLESANKIRDELKEYYMYENNAGY